MAFTVSPLDGFGQLGEYFHGQIQAANPDEILPEPFGLSVIQRAPE